MLQTQKRQKTIKFQSKMPRKAMQIVPVPQRETKDIYSSQLLRRLKMRPSDSDSEGEGKGKEQEIQELSALEVRGGLLFGTIYRHVAKGT
jgi:hypothetical protein